MSTSVLAKEFERLAERNAQLLHTDEGEGKSIAESAEKAGEFDTNLTRLEELKSLLEKEQQFDEIQKWASTPERKAAAFAQDPAEKPAPTPERKAYNPGRELVESEAFKSYIATIAPDGKVSENTDVHSAKFPVKALITGDAASGGAFFTIDYQNDLYVPYIQPNLTVRDLVLNLRTDADVISYPRAVTHANAAVEVAEATTSDPAVASANTTTGVISYDTTGTGIKPDGSFTWVQVTTSVEPIAEGVPISKRSLMNASMLEDIVSNQLRFDLAQRLNTQMISGNGTAPNIRGIRNTTGITTQAFSNNVIETLRKAKTKVSDPSTGSGKISNGAVLTPASMETLDLFRVGGSTTTDGPFLVNPFGGAQRTLWGMALVEEPGMTTSKAVVGYFRDAVLWDRQQATVEVFTQHKDFAMRNLVQLLAEWWGAFGVLQPKSFCDATMA
jgi:HK97 family phage major capsid protein